MNTIISYHFLFFGLGCVITFFLDLTRRSSLKSMLIYQQECINRATKDAEFWQKLYEIEHEIVKIYKSNARS